MNRVTKSECGPDKSDKRDKRQTNEIGLGAPALGAPTDADADDIKEIEQLVSVALTELGKKPDSHQYR